MALSVIVLLGTALRIAGASGSLWLDEIWSLQNLEPLHGIGGIVWEISMDNNHFLNSFWMWIIGPDAPPLAIRAASITFGVASILMAARIGAREAGSAGAVFAALLFATSYAFVHYGSEARGYSGMIFGLLWAYHALLRFIDDPHDNRARLEFGLATAVGSLSQLLMLPAAGALAAGATLCVARRTRSLSETAGAAGHLASVAILGAAPVCIAIGAGLLNTHLFRLGDQHPFTWDAWYEGLGRIAAATFGFPESWGLAIPCIVAFVGALCALPALRREARFMTAALIFGLPAADAAASLPNLYMARFHLPVAVGLLLLAAQAAGRAWHEGRTRALVVAAALVGFCVGTALQLAPFLRAGRGDYAGAVRLIGNGSYDTSDYAAIARIVRFYAPREGVTPLHAPMRRCMDPLPEWFILVEDYVQVPSPLTYEVGPSGCTQVYNLVSVFPYSGLTGFRWTVYGRRGAATATGNAN